MIKCPDKTLPEWKELVEVVGENQAYYLWDQNNGHGLDKTPNGQPSKLFSDLLSRYNGDRNAAIQAKAKVYSEAFKNWFGDWLSDDKTNVSKVVDENGEPLIVYHGTTQNFDEFKVDKLGSNTGAGSAKLAFFATSEEFLARYYANRLTNEEFYQAQVKYYDPNLTREDLGIGPEEDDYVDRMQHSFNRESSTRIYKIYLKNKDVIDEYLELHPLGSNKVFISINNSEEWLYNKGLEDYVNEGFIVTQEQINAYNNGETIEIYRPELPMPKSVLGESFLSKIINNQIETKSIKKDTKFKQLFADIKEYEDFVENELQKIKQEKKKLKEQYLYQVKAIYLNIRNPKEDSDEGAAYRTQKFVNRVSNAISSGNDGGIIYATRDPFEADVYYFLDPNQAKAIDNQGAFSTQGNNIYNSLEDNDIHEVFRKQHLIHKWNNRWFINKNQYNSPEQLDVLADYITQEAYNMGYNVNFISNPLSTAVLFVRRDLQDVIPQSSEYSSVREIVEFLCDRFPGLKFGGIVSQKEAQLNQRAFIKDDTIYLVEGRFTNQIAIEEAIHPFVNTLYHTNKELFDSLYREISVQYPKLKADIEKRYSEYDRITKQQELIAQAFSRVFNEQYKSNKPSKLRDLLHKFIEWVRSLFTTNNVSTHDQINYINTSELPVMTLAELVQLIHTNDTKFTVDFNGEFNSLSEQQIKEVNKTYSRIQQGLKNRLKSVKRYTTKNPRLWNQLSTVISQLANSEAEQGILQFLQHISDTISDAVKFLQRPIDEINAKQIRQLSQDYVGFYKPLLDDILYLFDTTDIFKDLPNYAELQRNAQRLSTEMDQVYNRFVHLLKAKGISELVSYLQSNNVPQSYIDKTLEWLNNPTNDISIFLNWFGMASNSNSMVTQAIAKMLNDTMNQTQRETMSKGVELVKLAQVAKEKYGVDVQKLLYEKLNDGTYSGYRVRPINYGQYKKDKQQYLDKLANKLGITKDKEGHYNLPNDEAIQKKWFDGINKFYSERVNRRFTSEYYTTRNRMLSVKTRDAIDEIQDYIDSIVSRVTRDGIQHDEELTTSEYQQLLMLKRQKQLLANRYNLDGSNKTGDDLLIANELSAFNEEVNKNVKREVDQERYDKDYKAIVKQYGSKDDPRVKLWVYRNTITRYNQAFYDRLDSLSKTPQSDLYKELVQRRRELTQLFKDPETGQINVDMLSDEQRAMLLQLDKDIDAARTYSSKEEDSDSFGSFAEVVYTQKYYDDARAAQEAGSTQYQQWYEQNHYEDQRGYMRPVRYYTVLKPKDYIADRYTETVPTGRYTKIDPTSNWYNPDYDNNGPAVQPKKEFYDNSKAYNEVMSKPEVKALYEAIVDTMNQANSYIPFLNMADDGRMSQMPARFAQVWARITGITDRLKYVVDEVVTTQADDFDYVEEFATMPNGDPIKVIPTRFIQMLENPNTISTDAVTATIAYYNMAVNFKNMQERQDDIELMLGLLKGMTIRNRKGTVQPGNSNLYKQAQLLVDRLMYGKNMNQVTANIFGKEINITKMATMLLNQIRKVNLSGNIWSIATSFFTDSTYTTLEAKLGRYFDKEDLQFATKEYTRRLPNIIENIGNPVPNDKLSYLMLLNQVVRDNREVFNRIDQSQVLRSINNNFWYLGYTQSDYLVKSHTLMSVYHNYRLVDGKFMSKAEFINTYYPSNKKAGEAAFKQIEITAFDAYNEDGTVKEEYKSRVTTKLMNDIKNRIDVLSRRIDGTLREVDKAQIHANFLGQYVIMHKNFMIQGLHDRFKKKQFNLDTQMEEDGYYRSMARFLRNIIGNRHFGLTQLLADYNQLQEYEQYAVRRVLHEMALFTSATLLALSLAALIDGDDDYDNWLMQSITYIALRSAFEFRTMYNPMEFFSLIKSPTAAFTWFDNASAFINLFNPFSYIGSGGPFAVIDRGVYEGMPRILRNIIKVTPIRSIIEAGDPESKRSYLQNQLMSF